MSGAPDRTARAKRKLRDLPRQTNEIATAGHFGYVPEFRIVRQLLTERMLLAITSGLLGIILALISIRLIRSFRPGMRASRG